MHSCSRPENCLSSTGLNALFSNSVQIHVTSTWSSLARRAPNAMIFLSIIAKLSSLWIICAFVWSSMATSLSIAWAPTQLRQLANQSTNMSFPLTQRYPAQYPPPWSLRLPYQLCSLVGAFQNHSFYHTFRPRLATQNGRCVSKPQFLPHFQTTVNSTTLSCLFTACLVFQCCKEFSRCSSLYSTTSCGLASLAFYLQDCIVLGHTIYSIATSGCS